jgi:SEC-C motif-containing protein
MESGGGANRHQGKQAQDLMARRLKLQVCPCGSAAAYHACCGRFIEHKEVPQTALELMRSRYTAHVLRDSAYLQQTWHRGKRVIEPHGADDRAAKWIGLEVLRHTADGAAATVEFVARYKFGGRAQRMHEISRFVREDGRWFYLDGHDPEDDINLAGPSDA